MSINNYWRNKQLGHGFKFLQQEINCLNFLNKHKNLVWGWYGPSENFYSYCKDNFIVDNSNATGLVIINFPTRTSPKEFVQKINSLIDEKICAVYLAVNRYEFVSQNDLDIDYQDDIAKSVKQIVNHIKIPLIADKIDSYHVDGKHFVGVHGLDIYKYENNQQLQ